MANADGTDAVRITDETNYNPIWSPNGTQIVYQSTRDSSGGNREIYIVNVDDTDEVQVTDSKEHILYRQITWLP